MSRSHVFAPTLLALAVLASTPSVGAQEADLPDPATATFRSPHHHRPAIWGLIAATFLIFCGALGANDRRQGDRPESQPSPGNGPPGYR